MQLRFPWEADTPAPPAAPVRAPAPSPEGAATKSRGRRATLAAVPVAEPGWRLHHLTVSGPASDVAAFAGAARGAGVTPWRLDFAALEEDVFHLAAAQPAPPRTLTIAGCRILARQFRARVEARQAKAAALVGGSRACPFDLQALLPVPATILQLGPTHPTSLAWLSAHWGVTDRLRQVAERPRPTTGRRLPAGHAVVGYSFFTADETPHAAIAALGACWPALRFVLRPRPPG
jgi:hypothetical protein